MEKRLDLIATQALAGILAGNPNAAPGHAAADALAHAKALDALLSKTAQPAENGKEDAKE